MGRKNVSPQNLYETGQLYSAGALKVACVGLQCVGYNIALNRTIMEQAAKCHASGRWRTGWTGSGPPMLSSGTISAPPMITGDVLLGDLISSSNSGITHPHLQKSLPVNTSEFDASAPAADAAASAAASVLNEGSSLRVQLQDYMDATLLVKTGDAVKIASRVTAEVKVAV